MGFFTRLCDARADGSLYNRPYSRESRAKVAQSPLCATNVTRSVSCRILRT
jgi:hypothetical protein